MFIFNVGTLNLSLKVNIGKNQLLFTYDIDNFSKEQGLIYFSPYHYLPYKARNVLYILFSLVFYTLY